MTHDRLASLPSAGSEASLALQARGEYPCNHGGHSSSMPLTLTQERPGEVRRDRRVRRLCCADVVDDGRGLDRHDHAARTRLARRLAVLTFVRATELRAARWDEVDLEAAEWRIPSERMKMRAPHIVPLSRQAVETFAELRSIAGRCAYVFPSPGAEGFMSNNSMMFAMYRMGFHGRATVHGFRAVASTLLNEWAFIPIGSNASLPMAGLVFRHDLMAKTPNTVASHALIRLARETGDAAMQDRVVEALFSAYFTQGLDVGDLAVLAALAEGLESSARVLRRFSLSRQASMQYSMMKSWHVALGSMECPLSFSAETTCFRARSRPQSWCERCARRAQN
jgi:Phage integrase family